MEPLSHRVGDAAAEARRILGLPPPTTAGQEPQALDRLVATLVERLAEAGDDQAWTAQRAHEQQLAGIRRRCAGSASALDRVRVAVARLRQLTSAGELLANAAGELCSASDLDRVVVSTIRDGMMVAETVHFRDDPAGAREALEALRANPVRLEHPIIESELLRRHRATIVADAQRDPRVDGVTKAIMGWESYVAAPIAVRSSIIGVIHADLGSGRPAQAEHREVLWEFACGVAQACERANLRRTLRQEREQMRALLEWLNARSSELSDAPIELVPPPRAPQPPPQLLPEAALAAGDPDRAGLADVLTRREVEILRLLADGRTNRAIADELVISPGTVKFHVNGILRKLRVANRAEAVSRYFALLGVRPRPG